MADVFTNDLRIREQAVGANSNLWGGYLNTSLENIAEAFSYGTEALADSATQTLTLADGASDELRSFYVKLTGTLSQATTVTLAPNTISKVWMIENATSGGFDVTISQGSGANVTVGNGNVKMIATDGAGAGGVVHDLLTDLELAGHIYIKHAGGGMDEVARLTSVANSAGDGAFLGFVGNSTNKYYGFIGGYDIDTNKGGVKIGVGNGETAIADSMTALTIDNAGNVLIGGTTFDTGNFSGSAKGLNVFDATHPIVNLVESTGGTSLYMGKTTTQGFIGTADAHDLRFLTSDSDSMKIDAAGHVTMPKQPAFSAYTNAQNLNIPTDASAVTVNFGAEYYDQNGDYNTSTYTFTAPVTGKYQLMTNIYVNDADDAAQYIRIRIATSNRNYDQLYDPRVFDTDPTRYNFHSSVLADMDAADTAVIQISQYEGTAQMDVPASVVNNFSGYLVA